MTFTRIRTNYLCTVQAKNKQSIESKYAPDIETTKEPRDMVITSLPHLQVEGNRKRI